MWRQAITTLAVHYFLAARVARITAKNKQAKHIYLGLYRQESKANQRQLPCTIPTIWDQLTG